ncbi:LysR family transcriptional regulator [Pantoea sp. 18069]|uniref:LysR family transcriptional regulator n=1 Tax=Pantoea sp. 18069 TaxID=2681415 RepID=UPI0013584924|nr:LysR family transcriptional regulator [Pantoea sp. 18069]
MKMQLLATLSAVVRQGSFAQAAEQVNLTPSAVSLQMKQLEQHFGQPLFDRSARNARPTPFAIELAAVVDRSLAELESMRHVAGAAPAGNVRLGITESAMTTLLPQAFAALQRKAPKIALQIDRGTTPDLLLSLKAGRVDAAVVVRPVSGGSSRLLWTQLLREQFVLVVPAQMAPGTVKQILTHSPWIRLDRSVVAGQMAARFVNQLLPQRQPLLDVPGMDAIVAMVAAGIGVSVLPKIRYQLRDAYGVREIPLGRAAPVRQICMVRRVSDAGMQRLDAVEQAFVEAAAMP